MSKQKYHTNRIIEDLRTKREAVVDKCSRALIEKDGKTNFIKCEKAEKYSNCCTIYAFPIKKWRLGKCPMATHLEIETKKKFQRIGQQKTRRWH